MSYFREGTWWYNNVPITEARTSLLNDSFSLEQMLWQEEMGFWLWEADDFELTILNAKIHKLNLEIDPLIHAAQKAVDHG